MSRWPQKKLFEIAQVMMGQSPPGETYNTRGEGLPFFQGKAEFGDVYPTPGKWCSEPLKIAEPGDILLSVRAPVGPTNIVHVKSCIGRGLAAIRANQGLILPSLLLYFFKAYEQSIAQLGVGSTFNAIGKDDIGNLEIPVPPLSHQEQIVGILNESDHLRRLRAETDRRTAELIPALFHEMFGDPKSNPLAWPIREFGELGSNEDGKRVPVRESDRELRKGSYPYYGASGIIDWIDEYLFDGTALLVAEDGANLLARSTPIAFLATGKFWVNNHAHVITDNGEADLVYLCEFLNQIELKDFVTGSAQPKLNQANLNCIGVPTPPLALQRLFAARIAEIRTMEDEQASSRQHLNDLFQSLLHRAFQGEL